MQVFVEGECVVSVRMCVQNRARACVCANGEGVEVEGTGRRGKKSGTVLKMLAFTQSRKLIVRNFLFRKKGERERGGWGGGGGGGGMEKEGQTDRQTDGRTDG